MVARPLSAGHPARTRESRSAITAPCVRARRYGNQWVVITVSLCRGQRVGVEQNTVEFRPQARHYFLPETSMTRVGRDSHSEADLQNVTVGARDGIGQRLHQRALPTLHHLPVANSQFGVAAGKNCRERCPFRRSARVLSGDYGWRSCGHSCASFQCAVDAKISERRDRARRRRLTSRLFDSAPAERSSHRPTFRSRGSSYLSHRRGPGSGCPVRLE